MLGAYLTKESEADEALAGIGAFRKDVKLFDQLFTLSTVLFRFASDGRHEVGGHGGDSYGGEDIAERRHELGFDNLNSDVINETFQSNLYMHMRVLARTMIKWMNEWREDS